ncbi:DUF3526 domain-containing protein [Luteimonas sp BLCC-B24]|uniref:DUF3526 domain-containing protein n=1 Tax=Luteimonas sp. BLCC-B24 TaxID=3025317 RepID=UPI00234C32FD|nr:DUF3526 domain-containing protein [Luteimonas sp. BLCC-B24]MDC7807136.1 DUF3526 domain-containing protein [Luteimonas sp. BLCC-B24]
MIRPLSLLGQELRLAARDRALPWLLIAFAVTAFYGAWTGERWRADRAETVALVAAEIDEIMDNRREQFANATPGVQPFAAQPQGVPFRPVLPPGALGALSIGQAESYPYAGRMLPLSDDTIFDAFRVHVDNPAIKAVGRFDLAFVIIVLMPLMLLAATYDVWIGERERGVAALALAQPVSPTQLLLARMLVRGALVLVPMALLCGLALAWFSGVHLAELTMTLSTVLAYGLFWLAVALLVNVTIRHSATAAVVCGVVWFAVVALGPALALTAVDLARPAPSAIAQGNALRAVYLEHRADVRARPPLVEPDPAPRLPQRLRVFVDDALRLEARKAPIRAPYTAALADRRALVDAIRLVLPSVAAQDALDRIAGSDADRALAFQAQVLAFRGETRAWLAARLAADAPLSLEDYAHVPQFEFHEPDRRPPLLQDGLVLIAATLVLAGIALWRLRRRHPLDT